MDRARLARLQNGDKALFSELVRDHHNALLALATPIVGPSEAGEAVQNAWLKAYKGISGFEGKARVRTWLSRIVINEAKMQLRSRKKEVLLTDLGDEDSSDHPLADRFDQNGRWQRPPTTWHSDAPDDILMGRDLADCLQHLLRKMPSQQRSLLEMRDSAQLPFNEIPNYTSS